MGNLELALEHHRAGRLQQAETIYRQILAQQPDHAEALHLLGVVAQHTGRIPLAIDLIQRAIALNPREARYRSALGHCLRQIGRMDQAIACYRQAVSLAPDSAEAHGNLGASLRIEGSVDEATAHYLKAIQLQSDWPLLHNNLGVVLQKKKDYPGAVAAYEKAIALAPDYADAYCNLGSLHVAMGQPEQAVACCRKAVALQPHSAVAQFNLACALAGRGLLHEAIEAYERAISLNPDSVAAHYNMANTLRDSGRPDDAVTSYRRAIALQPELAEAHDNLGGVLKDLGRLDEAIASHREAIRLRPDRSAFHSNLLYALHFHPQTTAATLVAEQQQWAQRHARPLACQIRPHTNDRNPARPLRIGYVSPNLRGHVIGILLETFMVHHDRGYFFIACYSDTLGRDAVTDNLMSHSDLWRDVRRLSDEQLTEQIRQDQIDILVDLNAHMGSNRMLVFARKPAPVQVTYIGYPGSTGLETVDYRLTDHYLSPPAQASEGPEQLVYLPRGYWPYRPHAEAPPVSELAAASKGYITFSCFNNFAKINAGVIALWSRLLERVPGSRLALLIAGAERNSHVYEAFARHGIPRNRIMLFSPRPQAQFLQLYHDVDIALDPFPYNGHTTSHDALYMGVPLVTLAGQRAVGRAGVSILSNVGLTDLIAHSPEQYIHIAADLAANLPRLAELRSTLRQRLQQSPLMDAPGFARAIEAAYREMWRAWCQGG